MGREIFAAGKEPEGSVAGSYVDWRTTQQATKRSARKLKDNLVRTLDIDLGGDTMRGIWKWIQTALALIGGALGWYFGSIDGAFIALIVFCVIDYIIGAIRFGIVDKTLSSKLCLQKGSEKLLIFLLVGIANVLDNNIIGEGQVLRNAVVFFYVASEAISILEHAGQMGLPIPKKLAAILRELQDREK